MTVKTDLPAALSTKFNSSIPGGNTPDSRIAGHTSDQDATNYGNIPQLHLLFLFQGHLFKTGGWGHCVIEERRRAIFILFSSLRLETATLHTKKQLIANILPGMFHPNTRRVNLIILDVNGVM